MKDVNLRLLSLCKENKLNYRIKRFIPKDYRRINYQIAEKFLNASYKNQISRKPWKKSYWTGHEVQNLKESLLAIIERDELDKLKNVDDQVEKYISLYLRVLQEK